MHNPEAIVPKTEKLLVAKDLDVRYGSTQVLWGASISVAAGSVTSIIGPNGAGKTTTLNTIAGVLRVKKGQVSFDGRDITRFPPHARVKLRMSLVPEGRQLWPGMSVEENLLMGCYLPSLRHQSRDRLTQTYDLFPKLKERRQQLAGTLSGGEQQMCAIGRGLMSGPRLLMLDEPSLGLAPKIVDEIFRLVRDIAAKGVTILLVGQNVNYTLQVSDYGYVMDLGRIVLEGPAHQLLNDEHIRKTYLGVAEAH